MTKTALVFMLCFPIVSCKKAPPVSQPVCISTSNKSVVRPDSVQVINCNTFELEIVEPLTKQDVFLEKGDTTYLVFPDSGNFKVYYAIYGRQLTMSAAGYFTIAVK